MQINILKINKIYINSYDSRDLCIFYLHLSKNHQYSPTVKSIQKVVHKTFQESISTFCIGRAHSRLLLMETNYKFNVWKPFALAIKLIYKPWVIKTDIKLMLILTFQTIRKVAQLLSSPLWITKLMAQGGKRTKPGNWTNKMQKFELLG